MGTIVQIESELRRLASGTALNEAPSEIGLVRFIARCPFGVDEVLEKVKSVLKSVDASALIHDKNTAGWILPGWFVAACTPQMNPDEASEWLDSWKKLSLDEQIIAEEEKGWSLEEWLYWMEPVNRQWFFWDAEVSGACDHIILAVQVDSWPFPWGSLKWLFKAAGASSLEEGF